MLVLGIDAGGTATRALVTTIDGTRLGFGRAGAANPVSVPFSEAALALRAATDDALSSLDRSDVAAVVVGMAGSSRLSDPAVAAAFDLALPVSPHFVGDVVVAFAAGAQCLDGTVLISGTGAVAARIENGAQTQVADGLGWLLGDLGSGFWLGREAAALTARALYARAIPSPGRERTGLAAQIASSGGFSGQSAGLPTHGEGFPAHGGGFSGQGRGPAAPGGQRIGLVAAIADAVGQTDPDAFVVAVQGGSPQALARLAPVVAQAAGAGDPDALELAEAAAGHLAESACQVHQGGPIVLSGSVLRHFGELRDAVSRRLAERIPGVEVTLAEAGEVGAARLAARLLRFPTMTHAFVSPEQPTA